MQCLLFLSISSKYFDVFQHCFQTRIFIVFLFVTFAFLLHSQYYYFSLFLMLTSSSYQSYHVVNCKLSLYETTHMYSLSIHRVTVDPLARHFLIFLQFLLNVQYLMRRYCTTYSLGSRSSVTQSMHMGATKKLGHNHFYVFLLLALSSFNPLPLYDVTNFCLIIALQVSDEVHRSIKHPYRQMQAQHNTNLRFSIACLSLLLVSVLLSWVIDLILLSGDIHPHPWPDSDKYI